MRKFAQGFNMKRVLLALLLLFTVQVCFAQNKARVRADKAFADKDYITAAYYYDKALDNAETNTAGSVPYFSTPNGKTPAAEDAAYTTYQLAESYRLYQNFLQAEKWYKVVAESYEATYPLGRFWYGVCLRTDNHIDDAIKQLQIFIEKNPTKQEYIDLGNKELKNSLFAKQQLIATGTVTAAKMEGNMNSDGGDFGLNINNGRYWFSSSRAVRGDLKHMSRIYTGDADISSSKKRISLGTDKNINLQYGTPSLDASGKTMYFTIWHTETGDIKAGVYVTKLVGKGWTVPQKLNNYVNTEGYNAMQPFVTEDSKRLYFASNKPGGLGGTDIWVSDLDANGMPVNATNLGSEINSPDDEQAPYYNDITHKLVYSSKGFVGMGGFDLFMSVDSNQHWSAPQNLGAPYNSTKDDVYYFPDGKDANVFYVSSDRQSECCLNLFAVNEPKPDNGPKFLLTGIVINCADSEPLEGAKITLTDSLTQKAYTYLTNDAGAYRFDVPMRHTYKLKMEKEDYFTKILVLSQINQEMRDTLYAPVICEQFYQINKPIVIENILYDFNKYTLKPESRLVLNDLIKIMHDNPDITVELSSHTDSFGTQEFNRVLSLRRAQSCVDYIVNRGKVSKRRIHAMGYGASQPIAPNKLPNGEDNPAGRQLNRRTEFKVLSNK